MKNFPFSTFYTIDDVAANRKFSFFFLCIVQCFSDPFSHAFLSFCDNVAAIAAWLEFHVEANDNKNSLIFLLNNINWARIRSHFSIVLHKFEFFFYFFVILSMKNAFKQFFVAFSEGIWYSLHALIDVNSVVNDDGFIIIVPLLEAKLNNFFLDRWLG